MAGRRVRSAFHLPQLLRLPHPTSLSLHNHLHNRKIKQGYVCDKGASSVRLRGSQSKQSYQCCTQTEPAHGSGTHRALLRDKHAAVPRLFVFVRAAHGAFYPSRCCDLKNARSSFFFSFSI